MAQEVTIPDKRVNQMRGGDVQQIADEATAPAVIEGRKVESVISRKQWEDWFKIEARIIELSDDRKNDLSIAEDIVNISVLANNWRGVSVLIAGAEEQNRILPRTTSLGEAVEHLKGVTNSRISPLVVHTNGGHEAGYYIFDNEQFKGMIFIDEDSVMNPEAVENLSGEELERLAKLKVEHKQGLIGGADDGATSGTMNFSGAEIAALDQVKAKSDEGGFDDDKVPTELTVADFVPEEVKEVKELVDFEEEIEALQQRFQGRRVTLTAIVYQKPAQIQTPTQLQNNAQAQEFINNNALTTAQPAPAQVAASPSSNPFFAIRPGDIKP